MGRPKPNSWGRHLVDLSALDSETYAALWDAHGNAIAIMARRFHTRAKRAFLITTYEDLLDVGRMALCEAWARFPEGHPSGEGGLHSWIERIARWRMAEALAELRPEGLSVDVRADSHNGALYNCPAEVEHTEDKLQREQLRAWLRKQLGRLPARQATLVIAVMNGETYEEAGATLGISKTRASQEYHAGLTALQSAAKKSGISGLGAVAWPDDPFVR